MLVIGTFSTEASVKKISANGIWQLKSSSQTSTPIKRSLDNRKDLGIASVVHVFTGLAVNETIALQHSSSDTGVTVTTLGANLVSIPLKVSSGETLDYGLHQQTTTSSITDTGFVTTGIKTSVALPRITNNRLYMAASFNSQTITAPAIGTWQLEYRKGTTGSWTATGSQIDRTMSTNSDQGAVTLYGLVEGLPLGTYEVQVVCKSAAGKTVQTLNGTLAAVALSYGDDTSLPGGHFDGFSVTAPSLNRVGVTPYTGAQALMTLASAGSGIFASMNFTAVPTQDKTQIGAFDLSTTIGTSLLTSGNQENQRYFSSTSDYGSGGSAGYFPNLGAGTHPIYGRYMDVRGTVNATTVTLVGFATESITDANMSCGASLINEDFNGSTTPTGWVAHTYTDGNHTTVGIETNDTFRYPDVGTNGYLRLTEDVGSQRTTMIYTNNTLNTKKDFSFTADVRIQGTGSGADGLSFFWMSKASVDHVIAADDDVDSVADISGGAGEWQGAPHGTSVGSTTGMTVGYYEGIKGYSFEFDHYQNDGEFSEYNHFIRLDDWDHSASVAAADRNSDDDFYYGDGWIRASFKFNANLNGGTFSYYLENLTNGKFTETKTFTIADLATATGEDEWYDGFDEAYFGIGAATGGAHAEHLVDNVQVCTAFINDIGITKSVNDSTPAEGQVVQFTLQASNLGTNVATNVTVSDVLPTGLTYLSDNGGGAYTTNSGVWTVGELSPGDSATLIIAATINISTAGSSFTNMVTISTDSADDNDVNDQAVAVVTIQTSQPTPDCGQTYLVADNGGANGGNDWFTKINRTNGSDVAVGTGTGTDNIEAIAFNAVSTVLYAANAGDLGFIDTVTGVYSLIGSFGSGTGADGTQDFDDVDGLSFDPLTGILYGSVRRSGVPDLLIQINPATGAHIPSAFGSGVDYVVVNAVSNLYDIDDIAIDSYDGQMYAIANQAGSDDRLVKIDKFTGVATDVGALGVNDHEGLSFSNDGQLFGTTGSVGDDSLYDVDKTTGAATNRRELSVGSDYESSESLTCPPNRIEGTVFLDANTDGFLDGGDSGTSNVTVNLYRDSNTNGVYDSGEPLLATKQTDSNGEYAFDVASTGAFVLNVDTNTLPSGYSMTTDNIEAANFGDTVGVVESGNDFGLYIPATLYGYLFEDKDGNLLRNSGDIPITNALVTLEVNGIEVAITNTDQWGYYIFSDIPVGSATILVSRVDAELIDVPTDEPEASDETRNRAVTNTADTAMIVYPVVSGYGVLTTGEPLNFGFVYHPLSTEIMLKAYAAEDGQVMLDIYTVNENGNADIVIYAQIDNKWVEVGRVLSDALLGGSSMYTVVTTGLTPGESYYFQVLDEAGHIFESPLAITVALPSVSVAAIALNAEYVEMIFQTEPWQPYQLKMTTELGASAKWTTEYTRVEHPFEPGVWMTAAKEFTGTLDQTTTKVRVFRNHKRAFFKAVKFN